MEILSTGHLNRDELGTLYAIARDLSGANLSGANLEGANLRFALQLHFVGGRLR